MNMSDGFTITFYTELQNKKSEQNQSINKT